MLSHFYSVLTDVLTGLVADLIAKLLRADVIALCLRWNVQICWPIFKLSWLLLLPKKKKKKKKKKHISSGFTIHHLEHGKNICHLAQYDVNILLGQ